MATQSAQHDLQVGTSTSSFLSFKAAKAPKSAKFAKPPKKANDAPPITRWWPIELLWVCGAPTLQGWVTWRRHGIGPTDGQVTIVFTTPGICDKPLWQCVTPPVNNMRRRPDYALDPGTVDDVRAERGMWLVTARCSTTPVERTACDVDMPGFSPDDDTLPMAPGSTSAMLAMRSVKHLSPDDPPDVVVVRPSEIDGGVLGRPTPYVK